MYLRKFVSSFSTKHAEYYCHGTNSLKSGGRIWPETVPDSQWLASSCHPSIYHTSNSDRPQPFVVVFKVAAASIWTAFISWHLLHAAAVPQIVMLRERSGIDRFLSSSVKPAGPGRSNPGQMTVAGFRSWAWHFHCKIKVDRVHHDRLCSKPVAYVLQVSSILVACSMLFTCAGDSIVTDDCSVHIR